MFEIERGRLSAPLFHKSKLGRKRIFLVDGLSLCHYWMHAVGWISVIEQAVGPVDLNYQDSYTLTKIQP
jgi:hypothetical protein